MKEIFLKTILARCFSPEENISLSLLLRCSSVLLACVAAPAEPPTYPPLLASTF